MSRMMKNKSVQWPEDLVTVYNYQSDMDWDEDEYEYEFESDSETESESEGEGDDCEYYECICCGYSYDCITRKLRKIHLMNPCGHNICVHCFPELKLFGKVFLCPECGVEVSDHDVTGRDLYERMERENAQEKMRLLDLNRN
uniref:ORF89 n=1 Tax=Malaco herpesvirus 1 TaxID=3031797 RepID=A0AA48P7U2_9VIRU|nr:TPA_asm: ORF89 [Malaco herpesvirus 1]